MLLFSLSAEATQESPLRKSFSEEPQKVAASTERLRECLRKSPDDMNDNNEAREIIEEIQRAIKKAITQKSQNAHSETITSATKKPEGSSLVSRKMNPQIVKRFQKVNNVSKVY
jgi:hypothetical protein